MLLALVDIAKQKFPPIFASLSLRAKCERNLITVMCVTYFQPEHYVIADENFLISVTKVLFLTVTTNLKRGPILVQHVQYKHSPY